MGEINPFRVCEHEMAAIGLIGMTNKNDCNGMGILLKK